MDIYLLPPGEPTLHVPVNPSQITWGKSKQYDTVNILNLGEVDLPFGEKLKEVSFSSFFPAEYRASYCRYANLPDPNEAMKLLEEWTDSEKPVRLIITGTNINMLVLVTASGGTIQGGEPGDIYYSVTFRAWRELKMGTAKVVVATQAVKSASASRPDTKPVPKVYTVKPGDTLYNIAKKELTDGNKWRDIYNNNLNTIGKNPNVILPGQKLVMPT